MRSSSTQRYRGNHHPWKSSWFTAAVILCVATVCTNAEDNGNTSVSHLRKVLFEEYDKLIRPVKDQKTITTVKINMAPLFIRQLDENKQIIELDTWFTMQWNDEYLVWDPEEYGGIKSFNIPSTEIWRPDLSIYAGSPDEKLLFDVYTQVIISNNGDVMWVPPVTIHNRCPLDISAYPHDSQTCVVRIGSWTYHGFMVDIQKYADQVTFDYFKNNNPNWELRAITSERQDKYYPCCKEPYPVMNYNITIKRKSPGPIAIAAKTSHFAVFLALLMFWLPPDSVQKILLGALSELILSMIILYLGISLDTPATQLKAASCTYMSMCFVAGAIILELMIINLGRTMGPCRPPRFLIRMSNGCCRTFCVCVSRPYPGGDLVESTINSHKIKKRIPSAQEEWNLVAMAFDRVLFFCAVIICIVINKLL